MIFARAMAVACLTVMKALAWFTSVMLLLLTLVQYLRGDETARPLLNVGIAAVFAITALAAARFAQVFEDRST